MNFATSHHLWRPMAAISAQLPAMPTTTTTSIIGDNRSPLVATSTSATIAVSTGADETNDVWLQIRGMVLRNGSDGYLGDLVAGNETNCTGSGNVWFNETDTVYGNTTWEIVGMVGTAIALGLIILATVIGE